MTLLTVAEFRAYVTSELSDVALQAMLDAAEAEINAAAGAAGSALELVCGGTHQLVLARPASAITSITETRSTTVTTLAANDYLLYPGGYVIERLSGGTNSNHYWRGRVAVTYTPVVDTALRKDVQRELVSLGLNTRHGVTSETIGAWSETFGASAAWNADTERGTILARLSPDPYLAIVGC